MVCLSRVHVLDIECPDHLRQERRAWKKRINCSFPRGGGSTTLYLYLSLTLPTQCHPAQTLVHFLDAPFLFYQFLVRATAKGVEVKGKVAVRGKGEEERWPPAKPGDVGTSVTLFFSSGRVL